MATAELLTTLPALRGFVAAARGDGRRIALVPTMGALHAGHLALVEAAKAHADRVIVSIFVNPAQFAPHEDFDRYPRTLDADLAALSAQGLCDGVYAPDRATMYPDGAVTAVEVAGGPAAGLETEFRPHFFRGVATVVAKLFIQCAPDAALFGEKDYQQLLVVRRMVRDLGLPVDVIGVPTVREAGGLALSSRNAYLSPAERGTAAMLNVVLDEAARAWAGGDDAAEAAAAEALIAEGFARVDYVAIRDAASLGPAVRARPARILAAAWLGTTRLIDNRAVPA